MKHQRCVLILSVEASMHPDKHNNEHLAKSFVHIERERGKKKQDRERERESYINKYAYICICINSPACQTCANAWRQRRRVRSTYSLHYGHNSCPVTWKITRVPLKVKRLLLQRVCASLRRSWLCQRPQAVLGCCQPASQECVSNLKPHETVPSQAR